MESHEAGFPPFPHSLEIPSGFPHYHGLDDESGSLKQGQNSKMKPKPLRGAVTHVFGLFCNACPGTLTYEEGLVSLLGAERRESVAFGELRGGAGMGRLREKAGLSPAWNWGRAQPFPTPVSDKCSCENRVYLSAKR
jgi:hypothetical protein